MKQYINEVRKMQKIAGILNESQIEIGARFLDTEKDQVITIKKILGNSVHVESDKLKGHVWQWPKEEVENQIDSGRLQKQEDQID
jgi:hypothetical protein